VRRTIFLLVVAMLAAAVPAAAEQPQQRPPVTFAEVPPAASGITWVHDNAMSAERYLPETCGAGCAIFDFDNDGWMDIYLVNSGACDFFTPTKPISRTHSIGTTATARSPT
jgi:hypothetical protein